MFDMLLHFIQTSFKINFILVKISFFKLTGQSGMDTVKSGMRKRPPFSGQSGKVGNYALWEQFCE